MITAVDLIRLSSRIVLLSTLASLVVLLAPLRALAAENLIAVGDIARCSSTRDEATAAIVDGLPGTIAVLGDSVYSHGTYEEFLGCFEPSWGRHKGRIKPAMGNHELGTSSAAGYFLYFGDAARPLGASYYSYDLGNWHVVVLNSNCWFIGGCGQSTPQYTWLYRDLFENRAECILAYWHHPLFAAETDLDSPWLRPWWALLERFRADIVLNGHIHNYQRFAPMDSKGSVDSSGIRQFIVGTGGGWLFKLPSTLPSTLDVSKDMNYGVLGLTLDSGSYSWEFSSVSPDGFRDIGSASCSPAVTDDARVPSLQVGATREHVVFDDSEPGATTKIWGVLKDGDGAPIRRAEVFVERNHSGIWEKIATLHTNSAGRFDYWMRPRTTARYRAVASRFSALGVETDRTSDALTVTVRHRVNIHTSASLVRVGSTVRVYGIVEPRHSSGLVQLQRFNFGQSRWETVRVGALRSDSTYSFQYKPIIKGEKLLRVRVPWDRDHLGGFSSGVRVKVVPVTS